MPLTRYDKAGIRLCCDVCAIPEDGEPVPIIVDMAEARSEVFHHMFCSLKALSQGITDLQMYIRGMNEQIRHLDSLKRDLLKSLNARYAAFLQAREEERAQKEKEKEKEKDSGSAAGEADGAESVKYAIEFGAKRIGHGVRAYEDPSVVEELKSKSIPF